MLDFLSDIPAPVWVTFLTPVILVMLSRAARRPADHEGGWVVLRPSVAVYVVAVLSAIMAVLFGLMLLAGLQSLFAGHGSPANWMLVVLALPLTALMAFSALRLLFVQVRFNDAGVESYAYGRTSFAAWRDIVRFDSHALLGPQLHANNGRRIYVWRYLRGFPELVEALNARGIPVKLAR